MKQAVLVLVKPDGIHRKLVGHVFDKFAQTNLELVAIKIAKTTRKIAEQHYVHLKEKPFFNNLIEYLLGAFHNEKKLLAIIYYGKDAVKKCRKVAGKTNPEEASPTSIRGAYGRITTKGVFENVVHVSSGVREAEREIKLWFNPRDIAGHIYPTMTKIINGTKKKVWT